MRAKFTFSALWLACVYFFTGLSYLDWPALRRGFDLFRTKRISGFADVRSFLRTIGAWHHYQFNSRHTLFLQSSKLMSLNSTAVWRYSLMAGDVEPLNQDEIDDRYQWLLAQDDVNATQLAEWRFASEIRYFVVDVVIKMSTMDVSVTTETFNYGVLPFLSDLGGFFNFVALAFNLLFPLVFFAPPSRRFVVSRLVGWMHQSQSTAQPDQSKKLSSDVEMPARPHSAMAPIDSDSEDQKIRLQL